MRDRGLWVTTRTQGQVLGNLAIGPVRPTMLARVIGISSQAMSQILGDLVMAGIVVIMPDPTDGRARIVQLTEGGAAYLRTARQILADMERIWETKFDPSVINLVRMVFQTKWSSDDKIGGDVQADQVSEPSLVVYLWRAMRWFDDGLQNRLQESGRLSTYRTQSQVLANLGLGETRPTRLARKVGISPQAMSQMLGELRKSGLVEVIPDREDGRARVVNLSAKGQEYLDFADSIFLDMEKELEGRFGLAVIDVVRMVLSTDWTAEERKLALEYT